MKSKSGFMAIMLTSALSKEMSSSFSHLNFCGSNKSFDPNEIRKAKKKNQRNKSQRRK